MQKTIMIQGAMDIELDYMVATVTNLQKETIGGYMFYKGSQGNVDIILSKTEMGIIHAVTSTTLGIEHFHPDYVINQGTAGGHREDIHTGDLVICTEAVYLNDLRMPLRKEGEGSNALEWELSPHSLGIESTESLISLFDGVSYDGKKWKGIMGSGDIYSRETDRIHWLQRQRSELCEDMETYGVYTVCQRLGVPHIAVRVISNNELIGEVFDPSVCEKLQKYILSIVLQK